MWNLSADISVRYISGDFSFGVIVEGRGGGEELYADQPQHQNDKNKC